MQSAGDFMNCCRRRNFVLRPAAFPIMIPRHPGASGLVRLLTAAAKGARSASAATSNGKRARRKKAEDAEATPEPTHDASPAQPLITMQDLLDAAPRGTKSTAFSQVDRWVVFSDLHLSAKSAPTCEQVLARVHEEALRRDAGVLFLGDFWDKRGDLPVEPLNKVIVALQQWTQPLIMLTGNHDQVCVWPDDFMAWVHGARAGMQEAAPEPQPQQPLRD